MRSLEITIGLFCLWIFSLNHLLKYLKSEFNVKHSEIIRMDLDDKYFVHTLQRTIEIPVEEVTPHILNKCKTCMDFTSEFADISVGGAAPLKDWSVVIIRTKKGEDIFQSSLQGNAIRTMSIEEHGDVFAHLMATAMHKKRIALSEVKKMEKEGLSIPPIDHTFTFLQREASIMADTKVKDVMTKEVMTVHPKISVTQLLEIMTRHHHMGYPVINDNGELVGMVTFEDIMKIPKDKRDATLINRIVKRKLITAHPDDLVLDAFHQMSEHEIGRLLIIDPENPKKLHGILTRTDIMHALRKQF